MRPRKLTDREVMLALNMHFSLGAKIADIRRCFDNKVSAGSLSQIMIGLTYRDVFDRYMTARREIFNE